MRWRTMAPRRDWTVGLALRTARLRRIYRFVRAEFRDSAPLGLRGRVRAWRAGFASKSYALYGLDENDPAQYLPDFVDSDYRHTDPLADAINNKLIFPRVMRALGVPHARVFGYLHRGWFHPTGPAETRTAVSAALPALLERHGRLVLKPARGAAGLGVNFVNVRDGRGWINGSPASLEEITALAATLERYLALEFVEQAAYAARLFPGTTNTLRVLTLWDVDRGRPFAAAATHRIGTPATIPVDNFHAGRGGICARIDMDTGTLGPALTLTPGGTRARFERHPDTGAQIAGVRVPGWPSTMARIVEVAERLPEAPLIGWDIVPTEGGPVWLEANVPPGTAVWQVHQPLLADPRVRRFYEALGWI